MLAVGRDWLQEIDFAFLFLAAGIAIAIAVGAFRRGVWRNPLSGHEPPAASGGFLGVLAAILLFGLVGQLAAQVTLHGADPQTVTRPGSPQWHITQICGDVGKLTASVLMAALVIHGARSSRRPRFGWGAAGLYGLVAFAPVTAICTLQLLAGRTLWRWLQPDAVQPIHVALVALQNSAWNAGGTPWGTAQLFVGAVLVAPLAEELFFRGVLLSATFAALRHGWLAITLSGFAFGAVHSSQPQDVLPLSFMGVALGYLRVRSGSLLPGIVVHLLFNLRTMVFATLAPEMIQ